MNATASGTDGPPLPTTFGAALRRLRLLAGWSQVRLASELGYHHSVISRWETGDRNPPLHQLGRLDELLRTGGRLTRMCTGSEEGRFRDPWPYEPPVRATHGPGGSGLTVRDGGSWPSRLPHHGVRCPLHGAADCAVLPPERANALWHTFAADPRHTLGEDIIHILAAHLAVGVRGTEVPGHCADGTAIEWVIRLLTHGQREPDGRFGSALTRLAAGYASLAGQLRMLRGQLGAAMAFYDRGLRWASNCDDTALKVTILCDMNALARLEHDGASAVGHARALLSVARGLSWAESLAHLHLARGFALLGDTRETTRNVARCRAALGEPVGSTGPGPDWITGDQGRALIEAGVGGALRDVAVATADRGLAREALDATEHSMSLVPVQHRPAAVLLGLRLADCHACAGRPDAAAAVASGLLAEALTTTRATIGHELRGLLGRLATRRPHLVPAHAYSFAADGRTSSGR